MKWCVLKCVAFFGLVLNITGHPQELRGNNGQQYNFGECDVGKCGCMKSSNGRLMYLTTYMGSPFIFFPVSSQFVQFRVRASHDAVIGLSCTGSLSPMVEVFIGGYRNKKTVIRKNNKTPEKLIVDTPDILNGNEYRGFWVRWDGGVTSVGREGQTIPFASWEDPEPFPISFIGFRSSYSDDFDGRPSYWKIQDFRISAPDGKVGGDLPSSCLDTQDAEQCDGYCRDSNRFGECVEEKCECITSNNTRNGILYLGTDKDLQYKFFSISPSSGFVNFKVRAPNDAQIVLTSGPQASIPMVEISIGGARNKHTTIRKNSIAKNTVIVDTPDILNSNEFRGFTIQWDSGVIYVRREGQAVPLIAWQDPAPFSVRFIGYKTGSGADGSWKIQGLEDPSPNVVIMK